MKGHDVLGLLLQPKLVKLDKDIAFSSVCVCGRKRRSVCKCVVGREGQKKKIWNDLSVANSKQTGIRTVNLKEFLECGGPMRAGSVEI